MSKANQHILNLLKNGWIWVDFKSGEIYEKRKPNGSKCVSWPKKGYVNPAGYMQYQFNVNREHFCLHGHRIVWIAAKGVPSQDMCVDHINNVKTDNRLDNLQLLTKSQNSSKPQNWQNIKRVNDRRKMSEEQKANIIYQYIIEDTSLDELAKQYNTKSNVITDIIRKHYKSLEYYKLTKKQSQKNPNIFNIDFAIRFGNALENMTQSEKYCCSNLMYLAGQYQYAIWQIKELKATTKKDVDRVREEERKTYYQNAEELKEQYSSLLVDMLKVYIAYKFGIGCNIN